jgi:predicted hydrocarbon binding protein
MSDFIQTKYQTNPLEEAGNVDHKVAVLILVKFLVEKSLAEGVSTSKTGYDVGKFFGKGVIGIAGNDPNVILIQEITESQSTTIIRDIKARCFCFLKPGERCQPSNVQLCDFIMGIWEGALTEILGKEFKFTNRYPATKRKDKYCLMELSVKTT